MDMFNNLPKYFLFQFFMLEAFVIVIFSTFAHGYISEVTIDGTPYMGNIPGYESELRLPKRRTKLGC